MALTFISPPREPMDLHLIARGEPEGRGKRVGKACDCAMLEEESDCQSD